MKKMLILTGISMLLISCTDQDVENSSVVLDTVGGIADSVGGKYGKTIALLTTIGTTALGMYTTFKQSKKAKKEKAHKENVISAVQKAKATLSPDNKALLGKGLSENMSAETAEEVKETKAALKKDESS